MLILKINIVLKSPLACQISAVLLMFMVDSNYIYSFLKRFLRRLLTEMAY